MTIEQAMQWCNEDLALFPDRDMFGMVYRDGDAFTCETGLSIYFDQQFRLYGHDVVCYRSNKGNTDWWYTSWYKQAMQESEAGNE